jgi:hypothetical protein
MSHDDPEYGGDPSGDLEVEVAPLSTPRRPWEVSSPPNPLVTAVRSQRARRRGIVVAGVLTAVIAALIFSITPTREALRGVVFGPTATATEPVRGGEDNLYITVAPNWGSVSLDGRRLRTSPVVGVDQPLHLTRGVHVLRWSFAPIIAYSCQLTVPSAQGDNCPRRVGALPQQRGVATVVALQLSLKTLAAPAYRDSLIAAMQAALAAQTSSTTVYAGERYIHAGAGDNDIVTATQPLRATLSFNLDAENASALCLVGLTGPGGDCQMNGDCREICTAPWQAPQGAQAPDNGVWQAYIVGHESWRYTTYDGRLLADNQPGAGGQFRDLQNRGYTDEVIPIAISWDGADWHVTASIGVLSASPLPDPGCGPLWAEILGNQLIPPPSSAGWQASTVKYISAMPPVQGCLAVITTPNQPTLLVLQRFGVPMSANAVGRISGLLMADSYEQQLARRIYATMNVGATGG